MWKHILEMVGQYQVNMRLQVIFGESLDFTDQEFQVQDEFPELATKDTTSYASVLQQVIIGAGATVTQGLLSQESVVADQLPRETAVAWKRVESPGRSAFFVNAASPS